MPVIWLFSYKLKVKSEIRALKTKTQEISCVKTAIPASFYQTYPQEILKEF